jgi:membrane associated rhomboid family serine protease
VSVRQEWGGPPAGGLTLPRPADVTRKLLIVNGAVWFAVFLLMRFAPSLGAPLKSWLQLDPELWRAWSPLVPLWQLVTYGFLHAPFDVTHVLFNLLTLYFFGTALEGALGARRFLWHYMVALVLGGVVQLGLSFAALAAGREAYPTLGASGAVMAVLVAMATLQPDTRVIFILFPLRLRTLALILVGLDVFRMLSGGAGVAWAVHLSGAAYGFLAVRRGFVWSDPIEALAKRRQRAEVERRHEDAARLDELLARIHDKGLGSLSEREKAFLKRVSKRP